MKQAVINSYAIATLSLLSAASQAETLNDLIVKEFEYNFALSVVLTDTDVFTFGFHDFDPNQYFNLSNEDIGTADSLDLRKEIKEFTLPYSFDLAENETEKLTYRFNGAFICWALIKMFTSMKNLFQIEVKSSLSVGTTSLKWKSSSQNTLA